MRSVNTATSSVGHRPRQGDGTACGQCVCPTLPGAPRPLNPSPKTVLRLFEPSYPRWRPATAPCAAGGAGETRSKDCEACPSTRGRESVHPPTAGSRYRGQPERRTDRSTGDPAADRMEDERVGEHNLSRLLRCPREQVFGQRRDHDQDIHPDEEIDVLGDRGRVVDRQVAREPVKTRRRLRRSFHRGVEVGLSEPCRQAHDIVEREREEVEVRYGRSGARSAARRVDRTGERTEAGTAAKAADRDRRTLMDRGGACSAGGSADRSPDALFYSLLTE